MAKVCVLGDKMSIFGFAALGLETHVCETAEETRTRFRALCRQEAGVIYVTEKCAAWIPEEIEKVRFAVSPAVILIPGVSGNTGKGLEEVDKSVEKAVGSKII